MCYLLAAPAEGAGSAPFRSEGLSLMEGADGSGGSSRVGRISGVMKISTSSIVLPLLSWPKTY